MTTVPRLTALALPILVAAVFGVPAAWADTVVPGNQEVQGSQCVGPTCANGETFGGPGLYVKATDSPGIRLLQTGGSFGNQTWDVAGNEANFFVRDATNGSTLPFRIRPGAPTSSIDVGANGNILNVGLVQQNAGGMASPAAADGSDLLTKLSSVPINDYTYAGATHIAPDPATFMSTFGIGSQSNVLAPQDVAGVALAAVKALDAQVATIQTKPGPAGATGAAGPTGTTGIAGPAGATGDVGPAGAKGDTGATGATGPAGPSGTTDGTGSAGSAGSAGPIGPKGDTGATGPPGAPANLTALDDKVSALEKQNAELAKAVTELQKQVSLPVSLRIDLSGGRKMGQLLLARKTITLLVGCAGEACSINASGLVRAGSRVFGHLGARKAVVLAGNGGFAALRVTSTKALRSLVRGYLRAHHGAKVTLTLTADFTGADGAAATRTITIPVRLRT
jgi:Collagen triple helix repeat (20 copies)